MSSQLIILFAAALFAATLSAMVGMAGGTVLFAVFLTLQFSRDIAVPIHGVVQLVSNFTRLIAYFKSIKWHLIKYYLIGVIPGPLLGMPLRDYIDGNLARLIIGILLLYVLYGQKLKPTISAKEETKFLAAGVIAGVLGPVIGAIGPLVAPFFISNYFKKEEVIGTKSTCQAVAHMTKLLGYAGLYPSLVAYTKPSIVYSDYMHIIGPMCIIVIIGTFIGRYLIRYISEKQFVHIYKFALTALAFRLLYKAAMHLLA